jgi:hypothetical protein
MLTNICAMRDFDISEISIGFNIFIVVNIFNERFGRINLSFEIVLYDKWI